MLTTFVVSEPELTLKLDGIKGQLISKCLFGVFNPPKNEPKQVLCPIHVVTFTWISNLATDYIQKRTD